MLSVHLADDVFTAIARNMASDEQLAFKIRTALSEAFSNAILYCEKNSGDGNIEFRGRFRDGKFEASIINEGSGFADNDIEWDEFPSPKIESGRGLKIIRKLSDKVEFIKHRNNTFEVCMEFVTWKENQVNKQ